MERLDGIARGIIKQVRFLDGSFRRSKGNVVQLCWLLLSIVNKYTFLFEDMFDGFDVIKKKVPLVVDCLEGEEWVEVPFLIDGRRTPGEFWPQVQAKAAALLKIVRDRRGQKGVVFTRNVRLSDELALRAAARQIPALIVDGRLPDKQRFATMREFAARSSGLVIITRTTGKRGLDIPAADYVVVYSPKSDEYTMWQELSRIRSTLGHNKDSYILYYDGTAESERLHRLKDDMRTSANRYKFVE